MYDDYNNERRTDDRYDNGYVNVGSSGTNSANKYEDAKTGTGYGEYRRPHYTSYQDAKSTGYAGSTYSQNSNRSYGSGSGGSGKSTNGKKNFWKKAAAAIVAGVLLGGSAAGAFYGVYKISDLDDAVATRADAKATAEQASIAATTAARDSENVKTTVTVTGGANGTGVAEVVEDAMPAVVAITNAMTVRGQTWWGQTVEQTGKAAGSGIIVGKNDNELLIATNQHVISDATELSVQFVNGSSAEANLKGQDEEADIAVIAVAFDSLSDNTLDEIKVATLGDSNDLQVGEQVVAIGNAMGYGQTTTTGIISALGREAQLSNGKHELIQTDAAINPGNSGGALLNMKGELIGINEAKAGQVLSNGTIVEGMGYAIPISYARPIIDELMNKSTKTKAAESNQSYLGIGGVDVTDEVATNYDIPEGIYVAQVEAGSAADKAGLVRGDVITKFDGQSVGSMSDLKDLMQYYEAGTTVELTIKKQAEGGYSEEKVEVTLGKRPSDMAQ